MADTKTKGEILALLDQLEGEYWLKDNFSELVQDHIELAAFITNAGGPAEMQEKLAKLGWALRLMTSAYLEVALVAESTESHLRRFELKNCISEAGVSIGG